MSSLFDLTGKVAVITGASKGIGRAIAERMAEHGAKVVVSSRKQDACDVVTAGIVAKGGTAVTKTCNIGPQGGAPGPRRFRRRDLWRYRHPRLRTRR
jgi:NAD(P)-dependent dehydrogenase (short-subunit alcohol dehydrogenase family)